MKNRRIILLYILYFILPVSAFAHTGFESKEGAISNLIALGIVLFSIIIFLVVSSWRNNKKTKNVNGTFVKNEENEKTAKQN